MLAMLQDSTYFERVWNRPIAYDSHVMIEGVEKLFLA